MLPDKQTRGQVLACLARCPEGAAVVCRVCETILQGIDERLHVTATHRAKIMDVAMLPKSVEAIVYHMQAKCVFAYLVLQTESVD